MSDQKPASIEDVLEEAYRQSYRAYLRTLQEGLGKMDVDTIDLPSAGGTLRPPWWPPFWPWPPTGGGGGAGGVVGPPVAPSGPPGDPPSPTPVKFQ